MNKARHSDQARAAGAWRKLATNAPASPSARPSFRPERPQGAKRRNLPTNATPLPSALAAAGAHVGRCLDFARSLRSRASLDMTAAAVGVFVLWGEWKVFSIFAGK
jgi:hypothetical protein